MVVTCQTYTLEYEYTNKGKQNGNHPHHNRHNRNHRWHRNQHLGGTILGNVSDLSPILITTTNKGQTNGNATLGRM